MNRIVKIQERLRKDYYDVPGSFGEMSKRITMDVKYLLSKLEIAETALESAEMDLRSYCGLNGNIACSYQTIAHALQQIKEPG